MATGSMSELHVIGTCRLVTSAFWAIRTINDDGSRATRTINDDGSRAIRTLDRPAGRRAHHHRVTETVNLYMMVVEWLKL